MGLIEDIGEGPVGLDTAVFIYFIEEHPDYLPLVEALFQAVDEERLQAVTSTLTLLETLVVPYRTANVALAESYETILGHSRGLQLLDIDRRLSRYAAQLRAALGLKTPDALQIAAALGSGCTAFVTNDRALPSFE
ncbi:MAG: PIN domain-containing protein, partial [Thermoanaerobaculia bacterium]